MASQICWPGKLLPYRRVNTHVAHGSNATQSFHLPPRKADLPSSPPASPGQGVPVAHSPLSPLTPSSPTFPDGILTPLWVGKHQRLVPAAAIHALPFCADPNMSTLRDNQLKIAIRDLRETWASSGYKSRFVVILVGEEGLEARDMDERLASIRRATNLDPRSLFVLHPDLSPTEVKEFVRSLLVSLQSTVVEYYRDLSKHARRKRNRGSIPPPTAPPTGTSRILSLQEWNIRYEFKLGIFAEFRQEMEAAQRNYESAYDILFSQGVFESIGGRFNDARLLSDALAIRIIRCLLWTGQTTAAVRFWLSHQYRIEDLVRWRGRGAQSYGWEAWLARWSTVMAQLITRAQLPGFSPDMLQDPERLHQSIYHPPEKNTVQSDRILPWEYLHHEGYWLHRSAAHLSRRRRLAEQIPEEDRVPPDQQATSTGRSQFYDTYLVPEPHLEAGFDHSVPTINALKASLAHFAARQQTRKAEGLSLEIAIEYIRTEQWEEAHKILLPIWPRLTWRSSGWFDLMAEFAWTLRECSLKVGDYETLMWVNWELLNRVFPPRPEWDYNLHRCLEDVDVGIPKPTIVLRAGDVIPCLSASLVFEKAQGNVGEPLQLQLAITSVAQLDSAPITLSEVKMAFEGGLRPIILLLQESQESETTSDQIATVPLRDSTDSLDSSTLSSPTHGLAPMVGTADLKFHPSQTKVFNLTAIPREAGEVKIGSLDLSIETDKFNLVYTNISPKEASSYWWDETAGAPKKRRIGRNRDTAVCKIQPKPPKVAISTLNLRETYYTNEEVVLTAAIQNNEDEDAEATLQVRLFGRPESKLTLSWLDQSETADDADMEAVNSAHLISRSIGTLAQSGTLEIPVGISNTVDALTYELEISVRYFLRSDPETRIAKTIVTKLAFVRPFEANYELLPRIHPDPWPDFFHPDEAADGEAAKPTGLQQRWCLNAKVVSFASEPLVVEKATLVMLNLHGAAVCDIGPEVLVTPEAPQILPEELRESEFILNVQKQSLEDRRSAAIDLALHIQWRRPTSDETAPKQSAVTVLAVPRFMLPMGEPRVLASAVCSKSQPGLVHVDYTLENPSLHFLTFTLTMEANEHFAFSGPKTKAIQLVPLSRHTVRYNILAFKPGMWIQPRLLVVDTYFNKTLRVLPTEGIRSDKKGILIWVDAE